MLFTGEHATEADVAKGIVNGVEERAGGIEVQLRGMLADDSGQLHNLTDGRSRCGGAILIDGNFCILNHLFHIQGYRAVIHP